MGTETMNPNRHKLYLHVKNISINLSLGIKKNEINPFTYGNLKPEKLLIILHKTISNIRGNQGII